MTWTVILPLLRKAAPYLAVVAVVGMVFGVGYQRGAAKWKSKFQTVTQNFQAERNAHALTRAERDTARAAVTACNEATEAFKAESDARIARLDAALAEKPPIIVEYRDAADNTATTITAPDCVTALAQAAAVLDGVVPP